MPTLNWIGKEAVVNHDKEVPFRLLKKVKSLSVRENAQNLIIKGDNLEALKALMPYYSGKIKLIYIDPPYNTGNENWVYNDKVNSPKIKKWLGKVVGSESEDLCRHDKWLCMMYPRLKLLRDLLEESGAIFISIDDNEVKNLKGIMDEIFGEMNFIGQITLQSNPRGSQASNYLANVHEYLLIYAKDIKVFKMTGVEIPEYTLSEFKYIHKSGRKYRLLGLRQRGGEWKREQRPKMFFPIYVNPKNGKVSTTKNKEYSKEALPQRPSGEEGRWKWNKEKVENNIEFIIGKKVNRKGEEDFWDIFHMDFLESESGEERLAKVKTIWIEREINYQNGRTELKKLFEGLDLFDYPKPVYLIKKILKMSGCKEGIILDSFAGSGTTGQAVMDLNKEDNGTRKFILIEMEDDIANNITAKRIKNAIKIYDYPEGFEFCGLDKPLFNEEGQIEEECGFEQLATYIYFTETNTNLDKKNISKNFIGEYNEIEYYLLFKEKGKNILNKDFLKKLGKDKKKKVIYADKCLIDDKILQRHNIQFKQIPYEVKVY